MIIKMNKNGPAWCRENIQEILTVMREEATQRRWWRFLVAIPGTSRPMVWMIEEAIRRAESDAARP